MSEARKGLSHVEFREAESLLRAANDVLRRVFYHFPNERKGGCFCIADIQTGQPYLVVSIGKVAEEKLGKYFLLCQEKARRLAEHPEHLSSWQSRDERMDRFGGAIRTKRYILSFSGLPQKLDEASMLAVAGRFGLMNRGEIEAIAAVSENEYWTVLRIKLIGYMATFS
jgi:hypothetical protein